MSREYEDLCERIRKEGGILAFEAAKLIERLSAEVAEKDKRLTAYENGWGEPATINALRKELAALRKQIAEAQPVAWTHKGELEYIKEGGARGSIYKENEDCDSEFVPLYLHPAADAKDAERFPGLVVQDIGYRYIDRKAIPHVLISFDVDDWDTRNRFAAAMKGGA